jgi:uncharacterized iron-regulated membrane protein
MKLNNAFIWLHRWLGLALCLTLFCIGLTGTLLVWKKEYLWLSLPDARQLVQTDIGSVAASIEKISSQYTKDQLLLLQIHSEDLSLYKAYIDEGKRAWYNQDGELVDQWKDNGRFEDWLLDLHHRFFLGNNFGLNIVGFSGILLVLMLLLGLIIWWPRRRTFTLRLLPSKFKGVNKSELIRSHCNLGVVALLPIIVTAISGIALTYPTQSREWLVDSFLGAEDYLLSEGPTDTLNGEEFSTWSQVLTRALQQYPNSTIRWVSPNTSYTPYRVVGLAQRDAWNKTGKTSIYIDSNEGFMDINIDALKRTKIERLYDFLYPLHTAKLGLWYRLALSLAGLSLLSIALLGALSFFTKR